MLWAGLGVSWLVGSRSSDDGGSYTLHRGPRHLANTIFDRPDLSVFTRLDDLGLEVTGQPHLARPCSVGVLYYG